EECESVFRERLCERDLVELAIESPPSVFRQRSHARDLRDLAGPAIYQRMHGVDAKARYDAVALEVRVRAVVVVPVPRALPCAVGILQDPVRLGALEAFLAQQLVIREQLQLAIRVPLPRPMSGDLDVPLLQQDLPRQVALRPCQSAESGEHDLIDPLLMPASP